MDKRPAKHPAAKAGECAERNSITEGSRVTMTLGDTTVDGFTWNCGEAHSTDLYNVLSKAHWRRLASRAKTCADGP